jgi:hypothetical protein
MAKRNSIPLEIRLRLFAASAGHCQKPECLDPLFPAEMGGVMHIAEMAHVIPHGEKGPRHEERPNQAFNPDSFDNLILLCPTCHTIIDKDAVAYPRSKVLSWKNEHLAHLALKQGIKPYEDRAKVRGVIAARLAENKAIWESLAPVDGTEFNYDPESDTAKTWTQRMRSIILPNHYWIKSIIEANNHLATDADRKVIALYMEHIRGLTERHIGDVDGSAPRFPKGMEELFT